MNKIYRSAVCLLLLLCAVPAAATDYIFRLTNEFTGAAVATFILPSSPTPDAVNDPTCPVECFYMEDVENQVDGSTIQYLTFYQQTSTSDLALSFEAGGEFTLIAGSYDDRPLYNGNEQSPTFNTSGSTPFNLYSDNGDEDPKTNTFYLLSVEAIPEPATWLMMIFGFGVVGFALRRRQPVASQGLAFA